MQCCRRLTCLLLIGLSAGCHLRPKTMGVGGEVSYDSQAIERGTIDFIPVAGTTGPSAGEAVVNGR